MSSFFGAIRKAFDQLPKVKIESETLVLRDGVDVSSNQDRSKCVICTNDLGTIRVSTPGVHGGDVYYCRTCGEPVLNNKRLRTVVETLEEGIWKPDPPDRRVV